MASAGMQTVTEPVIDREEHTAMQPRYHVVLLDDDDHTYDYVIRMLGELFHYKPERAYKLACEVDREKRVIVLTTTREHAELKQEQIHAFGKDPLINKCQGSMTAIIEPALDA